MIKFKVSKIGNRYLLLLSFMHLACIVPLVWGCMQNHLPTIYAFSAMELFWIVVTLLLLKRQNIVATSRVWFDEQGIHCKGIFLKEKMLKWENCKYIEFLHFDAKCNEYNYDILCFSLSYVESKKGNDGIGDYSDISDEKIYVAYNEFVWDEVIRYADPKIYNYALYMSKKIK